MSLLTFFSFLFFVLSFFRVFVIDVFSTLGIRGHAHFLKATAGAL
jgi:hypothetical protein